MELENGVASCRCVPATFGRACRYDYQEGRSRTRRRLSRQLDLRTTEWQRQEVERPRRLRRGPSAPMSCAGSIAVNQSPTHPLPRKHRSPTKLRSDVFYTKALRRCRRAFFIFFALTVSPPLRFG